MSAADLARAMQAFDDAALSNMANAGLLRRAQRDLESGKIALTSVDGDADGIKACLSVDGQTVAIGAAGPAAASCDCPAAGVCRHRIGAALFLRGFEDGAATTEETPTAEPANPFDIIAAISLTEAQKFAGRPGWRAAIELQKDMAAVEFSDSAIAVRFAGLNAPVLILRGQGMDGIISKAAKAAKKAYHAAAIIAARRHFDLPDGVEAGALEGGVATVPTPPDAAFIARIQAALADTARLGFNLAPEPLEETVFALSVSSRADSVPRLASVLRVIAAAIRHKRARAFDHDAGRMLELCAVAHALCKAAGTMDPMDARFAAITGQVRRGYELYEPITLTGCGAAQWRTHAAKGGGARGVTAYFLEESSGRFFTLSLARGAGQDPMFDPSTAYRQQSVWQAAAMADLSHARITLHNAGVANGGRLSSGKDVRAVVEEANAPLPIDHPAAHRDWAALNDALTQGFGLGLSATGTAQMALLSPANTAPPYFDELAQRLVWPACDAAGRWLALMLDHDERSEPTMARFEDYVQGLWRGMVLVRAMQQGGRVTISPVTLYGNGAPLNFTIPPLGWGAKDKRNWLKRLWSGKGQGLVMMPPSASARAVDAAWMHIIDRLEAGPQVARMLNDNRGAHAARLSDYGMARLSDLVAGADGPEAIFDAAYALMLARQQRAQLPLLG